MFMESLIIEYCVQVIAKLCKQNTIFLIMSLQLTINVASKFIPKITIISFRIQRSIFTIPDKISEFSFKKAHIVTIPPIIKGNI